MTLSRRPRVLDLGVVFALASCALADASPVRWPEEVWLGSGSLDDLRNAPGGEAITECRLEYCPSFPLDHVPSAFGARHVRGADVAMQAYHATGQRQERDQVVWWQYRLCTAK